MDAHDVFAAWDTNDPPIESLTAHLSTIITHPTPTLISAFHSIIDNFLKSNACTPQQLASAFAPLPDESDQHTLRGWKLTLLDTIWAYDEQLESFIGQFKENGENDRGTEENDARGKISELIREMMEQNVFPFVATATRLDSTLRDATFTTNPTYEWMRKTTIRTSTSRLYKQNKFNLFREESEGYSHLITELRSNLGRAAYPPGSHEVTIFPSETEEELSERAEKVLKNVKALIGYFELDPLRVSDVIIDIFSDNILCHYRFFHHLISLWIDQSGKIDDETIPSKALAQVLGFKFSSYIANTTENDVIKPDEQDKMYSLYLTTALLIRWRAIDLVDLFPNLAPDEEGMKKFQAKFLKQLQEKATRGAENSLTSAAPLTEEPDKRKDELQRPAPPRMSLREERRMKDHADREKAREDNEKAERIATERSDAVARARNQKVGILKALLTIGCIDEAQWCIAQWPNIMGAGDEVADLWLRLVTKSIDSWYEEISFTHTQFFNGLMDSTSPSTTIKMDVDDKEKEKEDKKEELVGKAWTARPFLTTVRIETSTSIVEAPHLSSSSSSERDREKRLFKEAIFFFQEWDDRVPKVTRTGSGSNFLRVAAPMCKVAGSYLARDSALLVKILRIATHATSANSGIDEFEKRAWSDFIRSNIFPAIAMTDSNPAHSAELWALLRNFSQEEVWTLYKDWKMGYRTPEWRCRKSEITTQTKSFLRRFSNENQRHIGRGIAKLAHSNPMVVFSIILTQAQSYPSIVEPAVETFKYLSNLEFDCFYFLLLDELTDSSRDKMKNDGAFAADWLLSLAEFTGRVFRRYPSTLDPTRVLFYVAWQLEEGQIQDLIILRSMFIRMADIDVFTNLTDSQHEGLSGFKLVRRETLNPTTAANVNARSANLQRSISKLMRSLVSTGLATELLRLVPAKRQEAIFRVNGESQDDHPKFLSNTLDSCQEVFIQMIELLSNNLSPDEYGRILPSLEQLCIENHIEPGNAFHIWRPKLTADVEAHDKRIAAAEQSQEKEEVSKPKDENESKTLPAPRPVITEPTWYPELSDAIAFAKKYLPDSVQNFMSPEFYVTFWQQSLEDIRHPLDNYDKERKRILALAEDIKARRVHIPGGTTRDVNEAVATLQRLYHSLVAEAADHMKRVTRMTDRVMKERLGYFLVPGSAPEAARKSSDALLQYCILPRARLSPTDALYCARYIRTLHDKGVPNFSTLLVYDKLFAESLAPLLFQSSEHEAVNYGRFLCHVLDHVHGLKKSKEVYHDQGIGGNRGGFQRVRTKWQPNQTIPTEDYLQFEEYRRVCYKWVTRLIGALMECLESKEYMHVKNALLVLDKIFIHHPRLEDGQPNSRYNHVEELRRLVSDLKADDSRPDIQVMANSYLVRLNKIEDNLKAERAKMEESKASATTDKTITSKERKETPVATSTSAIGPPQAPKSSTNPSGTISRSQTNGTTNISQDTSDRRTVPPSRESIQPARVTDLRQDGRDRSAHSIIPPRPDHLPARPEHVRQDSTGSRHSSARPDSFPRPTSGAHSPAVAKSQQRPPLANQPKPLSHPSLPKKPGSEHVSTPRPAPITSGVKTPPPATVESTTPSARTSIRHTDKGTSTPAKMEPLKTGDEEKGKSNISDARKEDFSSRNDTRGRDRDREREKRDPERSRQPSVDNSQSKEKDRRKVERGERDSRDSRDKYRDRDSHRERDRDRDRDRDKEKERERERDRDHNRRKRSPDRDREREKEKERDRKDDGKHRESKGTPSKREREEDRSRKDERKDRTREEEEPDTKRRRLEDVKGDSSNKTTRIDSALPDNVPAGPRAMGATNQTPNGPRTNNANNGRASSIPTGPRMQPPPPRQPSQVNAQVNASMEFKVKGRSSDPRASLQHALADAQKSNSENPSRPRERDRDDVGNNKRSLLSRMDNDKPVDDGGGKRHRTESSSDVSSSRKESTISRSESRTERPRDSRDSRDVRDSRDHKSSGSVRRR